MKILKIALKPYLNIFKVIFWALPQTSETPAQVLYGPVKIEVSATADFAAPVDIGAANGVKITENLKITKLENDNAVDRQRLTDQTIMIEWEQNEYLNEDAKAIIRGDIDTIVNVAAALVEEASQTIYSGSWEFNQFLPITNQNGDGTIIAIDSVTLATNGAIVAETDYFLGYDSSGIYGITIIDSATVTTEAQNVVIIYDYTPNASAAYYTGGKSDLENFYIRLTNEDENGKVVEWKSLGIGNITKGEEITFPKYNADDDRVKMPMAVEVTPDITLDAGKNLYVRTITEA
jgi:hypothetical protein